MRSANNFLFAIAGNERILSRMSARQIIEELPRLTTEELREVERRSAELAAQRGAALRAERVEGRLVLTGNRVVRQAEVEAILDELS